jgi:hypothetical protein
MYYFVNTVSSVSFQKSRIHFDNPFEFNGLHITRLDGRLCMDVVVNPMIVKNKSRREA